MPSTLVVNNYVGDFSHVCSVSDKTGERKALHGEQGRPNSIRSPSRNKMKHNENDE